MRDIKGYNRNEEDNKEEGGKWIKEKKDRKERREMRKIEVKSLKTADGANNEYNGIYTEQKN